MAARPARTWVIVTGVLLLLAQLVVVLAWWLLPVWRPDWVVAYSPWPAPALRAWRLHPGFHQEWGLPTLEDRLLDWGPAIGPGLLREFAISETQHRLELVALASELARKDGIRPGTQFGSETTRPWSPAQVAQVREDLLRLIEAALADGASYLPNNASYLAMPLADERVVPLFCAFLAKQKPPVFEDLEPPIRLLGMMRDARAVPVLIPLLPIRHRAHATVEDALDACLHDDSLPHVLAATQHAHEVIRTWAARQFPRFRSSAELAAQVVRLVDDPERQVRIAAIQGLSAADHHPVATHLLELAHDDSDPAVRLAAVEALGELVYLPAAPYLRSLVASEQDRLRSEAVVALGDLADAAAFPVLLPLLTHEDRPLALKAHWALSRLPLTAEQRRQVEAVWPIESSPEDQRPVRGAITPPP
jgi:HEAT repeat protein